MIIQKVKRPGVTLFTLGSELTRGILLIFAAGMSLATLLAIFGVLPWPVIPISYGASFVSGAGMWLQVGMTLFSIALLFFLPANARMAQLETSHRNFAVGISDVAHAYALAHAGDRASIFPLASEFDSVRTRMEHLREHPDLTHLEPEILQLAAQMSHESREMALAYSDRKVARARSFLREREQETEAFLDQLHLARSTCDELRRWKSEIDADEARIRIQIERLEADLEEVLPELGYRRDLPQEADIASPTSIAAVPNGHSAAPPPPPKAEAFPETAAEIDGTIEHALERALTDTPPPTATRPSPKASSSNRRYGQKSRRAKSQVSPSPTAEDNIVSLPGLANGNGSSASAALQASSSVMPRQNMQIMPAKSHSSAPPQAPS